MAEQILTPGVYINELDNSIITRGVSPATAAIVGPFEKGPFNIPVTVSSQDEFRAVFGTTEAGFISSYSAQALLKQAGSATIVRVNPGGGTNASMTLTGSGYRMVIEPLTDGASGNRDFELIFTTGSNFFNIDVVAFGTSGDRVPSYYENWRNLEMSASSANFAQRVIGNEKAYVDSTNNLVYSEGDFRVNSRYFRITEISGSGLPSGSFRFISTAGVVPNYAVTGSNGTLSTTISSGVTLTGSSNVMGMNMLVSGSNTAYDSYATILNLLANKDEYNINVLATPGIIQSLGNANSLIINKAIQVCEDRADVLYVFDAATTTVSRTPATTVAQVAGYNTSYAAAYAGWVQLYDSEYTRYVYVPAAALMPRVFAYSDAISDPWWAPAGLTRGGIPDAIKAYVKYTNAQKGALYEGRVNAIASFPAEGIAVWGQKTLQIRKSALDRINVRRLLIDAKKFVSSVGRTIAFDPNVNVTRQQFVARVTPYFEAIQQRSGLYAFKVVMDESNNTSDTIARNEIKAAIYIQPAYAGEFVLVDFNISPAGVEFNNI